MEIVPTGPKASRILRTKDPTKRSCRHMNIVKLALVLTIPDTNKSQLWPAIVSLTFRATILFYNSFFQSDNATLASGSWFTTNCIRVVDLTIYVVPHSYNL